MDFDYTEVSRFTQTKGETREWRKKEILKLLETRDNAKAVTIKQSDGTKKVVSEKAYRIICLKALLQPIDHIIPVHHDSVDNNAGIEMSKYHTILRPSKEIPSFLDRIKILKKKRKIARIIDDKDPSLDKLGIVSINIFPDNYSELVVGKEKISEEDLKDKILTTTIDCVVKETTRRKLAEAGLDPDELDFKEKEIETNKDTSNFIEHLKVDAKKDENIHKEQEDIKESISKSDKHKDERRANTIEIQYVENN